MIVVESGLFLYTLHAGETNGSIENRTQEIIVSREFSIEFTLNLHDAV